MGEHVERWRAKRATLVETHDAGALDELRSAIAGNSDVRCGAYCYGGSAVVDVAEVLADLAEAGWRLVRREVTPDE